LNYININGKITPAEEGHLPVDNGAFRYGYGLFETMLVRAGEIRLKDYHWDRLFEGAEQLYFEQPDEMSPEWLEAQVLQTVYQNELEDLCRVRLQLFAGGGGLYSAESSHPGFIIECFPLDSDTLKLNERGLVTGMAIGVGKCIDTLKNLKTCNALIYAIAAKQAQENNWNDAFICNENSRVIESTIANIFWIKDSVVYTPPLADGCVAGVMRRYIMEQIEVKEKSFTVHELTEADEVFLTNAIRGIRWVKNFAEYHYLKSQTQTIYQSLNLQELI
jgi:branched-subunit amino acid aminotransferase/4-amino-4-deoxychorismate lyase